MVRISQFRLYFQHRLYYLESHTIFFVTPLKFVHFPWHHFAYLQGWVYGLHFLSLFSATPLKFLHPLGGDHMELYDCLPCLRVLRLEFRGIYFIIILTYLCLFTACVEIFGFYPMIQNLTRMYIQYMLWKSHLV